MNLTEPQIEAVFEWIDLNVDRKTAIRFVKDFYHPQQTNEPVNFSDKFDEYLQKSRGNISAREALKRYKEKGIPTWEPNPFPILDSNGIQELLQMKSMANIKNEVREKYPEGTKIKTPMGETVEIVELIFSPESTTVRSRCKKNDIDRVEGVLVFEENPHGEDYWAEIITDIPEIHIDKNVGTDRLMEISLFSDGWSKEDIAKIKEYKCGTTIESYSYPGEKIRIGTSPIVCGKKLTALWSINERNDYRQDVVLAERNFNGTGNTYWATIVKP